MDEELQVHRQEDRRPLQSLLPRFLLHFYILLLDLFPNQKPWAEEGGLDSRIYKLFLKIFC